MGNNRATRVIYGLRQPGDTVIRYVGQTIDPVRRLQRHTTRPHGDGMSKWIEELSAIGQRPEMITLAQTQGHWSALGVERDWIASLSVLFGSLLFNHRHRGDFVPVCDVERAARRHKGRLESERRREWWKANRRRFRAENRARRKELEARLFTHGGETMVLARWAARIGVSRERMRQRVNACKREGVDVAEALLTPAGEVMPSFRNPGHRYRLRIAERNASMTKPEWFDGEVHVIKRGTDWEETISCESIRNVIQAEAAARDGKCKFRMLKGFLMFMFQKSAKKKKVSAA